MAPSRASSGALIPVTGAPVSGSASVIPRICRFSRLRLIRLEITLLHFGKPVGEVK